MIARALAAAAIVLALVSSAAAASWAWLGVRIRDLSEQEMNDVTARHGIREGFGVVIVEVPEDSPAAKSGLNAASKPAALAPPSAWRDAPSRKARRSMRPCT